MSLIKSLLLFSKCPLYGGQALINGVMMKGKKSYAISTYHQNQIKTKVFPFKSLTRYKLLNLPFIRGIINLVEMLILGYKALSYSSEESYTSEIQEEDQTSNAFGIAMIFSLFLSLILAVSLFKILPLFVATTINNYFPLSSIWFNLVDGITKLGIFIGYVYIIGRFEDIKDVFRYHGAEHKTINCYEAQKKLTVKNVQSYSTKHLRCGTTFILLVLLISIATYVFIPKTLPFFYNLGLRLALLPLIASVSYEFQRLTARTNFFLFRWLLYPGLFLQSLTTNEPSIKHV
ncbi:MAG: DUF1385 domain-containing protein, partial [Candidatus Nanoarchaeia archaeon]|nr:DUF1385 domain-containing protein [Candidatus Nanoarchaeia archaeon]